MKVALIGDIHGNLQALEQSSMEQMDVLSPSARSYFLSEGIDARNRRMLRNAMPYLEEGRVFIAVGALHLPGEHGLIGLLREAGFELSPLPMPFSAAQQGSQAQ